MDGHWGNIGAQGKDTLAPAQMWQEFFWVVHTISVLTMNSVPT